MTLHASYWEYLLRLMGLIIMVDKKVYQEEVEAFTKAAMQLQQELSPDMMMTRKMALDWFVNHRDRLAEVVYSLDYDRELNEVISQLHDLPEKVHVVKTIITIAMADGDYHKKEKMIMDKIVHYWKIDPSELDLEL